MPSPSFGPSRFIRINFPSFYFQSTVHNFLSIILRMDDFLEYTGQRQRLRAIEKAAKYDPQYGQERLESTSHHPLQNAPQKRIFFPARKMQPRWEFSPSKNTSTAKWCGGVWTVRQRERTGKKVYCFYNFI